MKLRLLPLLSLPVLFVLAGCVTETKPVAATATATATTAAATATKTGDDEYVTLPPKLGSHITRRVKKADLLAGKVPDATIDDVKQFDKDQFIRQVQSSGAMKESAR